MPALVIKSMPAALHARLKQTAAAHRRSLTQETIILLERALEKETSQPQEALRTNFWTQRKLLPGFEALLKSGEFLGGTDSAAMISEERSSREDALL